MGLDSNPYEAPEVPARAPVPRPVPWLQIGNTVHAFVVGSQVTVLAERYRAGTADIAAHLLFLICVACWTAFLVANRAHIRRAP